MKGVILAAGRGSRMGGITDNQPKCLISIAGETLLERQIEGFIENDIIEYGIVTGYLSHLIPNDDCTVFYNSCWEETNMVRSLCCANAWLLKDTCIVSYSDIIYSKDVIGALISCEGDIAISYNIDWRKLWELRFDDPLTDAETFRKDSSGKLIEIGNTAKSLDEIQGQFMGLLKITPKGWNNIAGYLKNVSEEVFDSLDITSLLQMLIQNGLEIETVSVNGNWFEIDNEKDLRLCKKLADEWNILFLANP